MTDAILDTLGGVLSRWTMGGSALSAAPAPWRAALDAGGGEGELRLLALSGQFLGALAVAEPSGELQPLRDIPRLPLPMIEGALRPPLRRVLAQLRDARMRRHLLDFLERRGWTIHPGDWMPGEADEVPDVYAPWQDWATTSGQASLTADLLSAESWDDHGPAARLSAFRALRRRHPAAASALLVEKIEAAPADHRLRLTEILSDGLSDADIPLLDLLMRDRAPRVKALAATLAARLGRGEISSEDSAELAGFFTVQTKGLLRRTRVVALQELKTQAQRSRLATLAELVPLATLAASLGMSMAELLAAWPVGQDKTADHQLGVMAGRSAPDPIVAAVADALTANLSHYPYALAPLLDRLTAEQRRQAATRVVRIDTSFSATLTIAGGGAELDDLIRTPPGTALIDSLKAEGNRSTEQAIELVCLGLIASRAGAQQALDRLTASGLIASDPRLDMLRLNAALEHKGASK